MWVLGGLRRVRKVSHALQIITRQFNHPHSVSSINNAQYIVHKTGTHWGEGHEWAKWLHNPCRLGVPQRFRAGDKISSGAQVGTLDTCMHFQ